MKQRRDKGKLEPRGTPQRKIGYNAKNTMPVPTRQVEEPSLKRLCAKHLAKPGEICFWKQNTPAPRNVHSMPTEFLRLKLTPLKVCAISNTHKSLIFEHILWERGEFIRVFTITKEFITPASETDVRTRQLVRAFA